MSFSAFTRRDWLRVVSGSAVGMLQTGWGLAVETYPPSRTSSGQILLSPELTEGPYYIDFERIRRDITEGKPGLPLRLSFRVIQAVTGAPVANAAVDVWHCDAQGIYSGFTSHGPPPHGHGPPPFGPGGPSPLAASGENAASPSHPPGEMPPGGGPPSFAGGPNGSHGFPGGHGGMHRPDNALTFLRGVQLTNADGIAEIDSIFPGWYAGRTTHVHVRVHFGGQEADGRYRGGHIAHTGQIFFPSDVTARVYQLPVYVRKQDDRMPLDQDGIFRQGGSQVAQVSPLDPLHWDSGLSSRNILVIDPDAKPGII